MTPRPAVEVRYSPARPWLLVLTALALTALVWHVLGIPRTPHRPTCWLLAIADLGVALLAAQQAVRALPRLCLGERDLTVAGRWRPQHVPLDTISSVLAHRDSRRQSLALFLFVLLIWLSALKPSRAPIVLIVGLLLLTTLLRPLLSTIGQRHLLTITAPAGDYVLAWSTERRREEFLNVLRARRPDLDVSSEHLVATRFGSSAPLAAQLISGLAATWLFFALLVSVSLRDLSVLDGANSQTQSLAELHVLTGRLTGLPRRDGVHPVITTEDCPRTHNNLLGPSPDVQTLLLIVEDPAASDAEVRFTGTRLAGAVGVKPDEFGDFDQQISYRRGANVTVQVTGPGLYVDVVVDCVPTNNGNPIDAQLRALASALGARP